MYRKKSSKPVVTTIAILSLAIICAGLLCVIYINNEINLYEDSNAAYIAYEPAPFINAAAYDADYTQPAGRGDALYFFKAPEGFTIISLSHAWNNEMLELLYEELKQNAHGEEIKKLNEIVVHPEDNDEMNALATYSPGIATADFHLRFPAFPKDFKAAFPIYIGIINIYGGDTKTTVESVAGSLSHEYGHHYTFYYMFDSEMRRLDLLGTSEYAKLRESGKHDLITSVNTDEDYMEKRHRYLIEVAAEDYVILMGSPATRQAADYYDVKQILENPELTSVGIGERNAFPQENMSIPLAIDVPRLAEYYYSFIDEQPREPIEEKQDIIIDINKQTAQYDLMSGARVYTHYEITWNTPYKDTIYTLSCYDPFEYTGGGTAIKTVRPGTRTMNSVSAIIGEYTIKKGNVVHSIDDEIAQGIKVFVVVAQLPDGTYYTSEPYEVNFN